MVGKTDRQTDTGVTDVGVIIISHNFCVAWKNGERSIVCCHSNTTMYMYIDLPVHLYAHTHTSFGKAISYMYMYIHVGVCVHVCIYVQCT